MMSDDVRAADRAGARPFRDIAEVAEADNAAEANKKLAEGWELLGIYQIVRPVRRPNQVRDEAADFGTQAHILVEQIIQGLEPEIPPEMVPVVDSFSAWRRQARLDIRLTETMVYSARYRYPGAMDAVAYRSGKLVALDSKTSNGLYPEYALQVAAHARALEEMTGRPVSEARAAHLGKREPEFEARKVVDIDAAFDAFRAALFLWRSMRQELM